MTVNEEQIRQLVETQVEEELYDEQNELADDIVGGES
jgi:hypothetical protein